MRTNLAKELDLDLETVVNMFTDKGWVQEDSNYIRKDIGIIINPDAKREEARTSLSIWFQPELLHYTETYLASVYVDSNTKKISEFTITPWIQGSISITNDNTSKYLSDNEKLNEVAKYMKKEILDLPIKPFYDEDAFLGYFSRPKLSHEYIEISFYLNPSYPKGYWENHTIE